MSAKKAVVVRATRSKKEAFWIAVPRAVNSKRSDAATADQTRDHAVGP